MRYVFLVALGVPSLGVALGFVSLPLDDPERWFRHLGAGLGMMFAALGVMLWRSDRPESQTPLAWCLAFFILAVALAWEGWHASVNAAPFSVADILFTIAPLLVIGGLALVVKSSGGISTK